MSFGCAVPAVEGAFFYRVGPLGEGFAFGCGELSVSSRRTIMAKGLAFGCGEQWQNGSRRRVWCGPLKRAILETYFNQFLVREASQQTIVPRGALCQPPAFAPCGAVFCCSPADSWCEKVVPTLLRVRGSWPAGVPS